MTCCWRGVMDQRLFRGLNFFDGAGARRSVGRTDRARDDRPGRQRNTKSASPLQIAWHSRGESRGCWECQCAAQTAVLPWLLWLAKQTISFLIMISRVIIYTKVTHSPILRRRGSCFPPLVKGKTACFHVLSQRWMWEAGSCCSQRNKVEHCLSPCPTANAIKCSYPCDPVDGRKERSLTR